MENYHIQTPYLSELAGGFNFKKKHMLVKLDSFPPRFGVNIKKPWNHHL